jgi:hypothetical protein
LVIASSHIREESSNQHSTKARCSIGTVAKLTGKLAAVGSQVRTKKSEQSKSNDPIPDESMEQTNMYSDRSAKTIAEEYSDSYEDHSNSFEEDDQDVESKLIPTSLVPLSSTLSSDGKVATEEDVRRVGEELQKNLEEEQMLLSLQMQLLLQLEKLNTAILSVESEERLAKLACQQAQVTRLRRRKNSQVEVDNETITIQVPS